MPWDYLDWLQGLFYCALERGQPKLAHKIHGIGFSGGGKRYKLVTFSLMCPEKYEKTPQGLHVRGRLRWWISSPLESVVEALALGLLAQPEVRFGIHTLHVGQISVLLPPTFTEKMTFITLSPIFVSTGHRNDEGKFCKRFLSPEEPEFTRVLVENLRRKFIAAYGEVSDGELRFEWLDEPRSKLFCVNKIKVRGWMLRFCVSGSTDLIRLGYDAGFGERNAQGFGMVCTPEEYPAAWRE